jgi:hypothetical protein
MSYLIEIVLVFSDGNDFWTFVGKVGMELGVLKESSLNVINTSFTIGRIAWS